MEEEELMRHKIALEERKILIAHRKLQTIRLLSDVFNRLKVSANQRDGCLMPHRNNELIEFEINNVDFIPFFFSSPSNNRKNWSDRKRNWKRNT